MTCFAKQFTASIQKFVSYPACCLFLSVFLFSTNIPSLFALDGWAATYGGHNYDWAESIQQTNDGGYIVTGYYTSYFIGGSFGSGIGGLWVLKLRPDGTVEWQKTYGGVSFEVAKSIQQTRDRGYIVAGRTRSFGAGKEDVWVLKLRPVGTVEWQKTYGGIDWDEAESVQQTRDEGYIVAGKTASFDLYKILDFCVLKLEPDGSMEPPCYFIRNTDASVLNSDATILDTCASVRNSNANPQISPSKVRVTNVSAKILCP